MFCFKERWNRTYCVLNSQSSVLKLINLRRSQITNQSALKLYDYYFAQMDLFFAAQQSLEYGGMIEGVEALLALLNELDEIGQNYPQFKEIIHILFKR